MRPVVLLLLAAVLAAGESATSAVPAVSTSSGDDAIAMLGKLPDPLVERQIADFFAGASSEEAGRVLMHVAISAIRPARPVVVPMLAHKDERDMLARARDLLSKALSS